MKAFLWRWLPRICCCHQRPDRSFFWKGQQFPVCARCTGTLTGIVLALLMALVYQPSVKEALVLMIPMMVDGFAQSLTEYESKNSRRLITGVLFGIGLTTLFFRSTVYAYEAGRTWGLTHFFASATN